MVLQKIFRIRYFRGAFENEPHEGCAVHDVLLDVARRRQNQRWIVFGSDEVALGEYRQSRRIRSPRVWLGELRRLRTQDRVAEGTHEGHVQDVNLDPGHFINECSYVLVVPSYKAILYHSCWHGPSWGQFRHYVSRSANRDDPVDFLPIINPNLIHELRAMPLPRKITFKIAQPDRWNIQDDPSLRETTALAGRFGADYMTMEMGIVRGRRRHLAQNVKRFLQRLLRQGEDTGGTVEKAMIEGYLQDDGTDKTVIDLLTHKLEDAKNYTMAGIDGVDDFRQMAYGFLEESLSQNRRILRQSWEESAEES